MAKRFNRLCHSCKQEKPVKYYIAEWQKTYEIPMPFAYCNECASNKKGLMLHRDWVAFREAMGKAGRNNAGLS